MPPAPVSEMTKGLPTVAAAPEAVDPLKTAAACSFQNLAGSPRSPVPPYHAGYELKAISVACARQTSLSFLFDAHVPKRVGSRSWTRAAFSAYAGHASARSLGPSLNHPHVSIAAWFIALSSISSSCLRCTARHAASAMLATETPGPSVSSHMSIPASSKRSSHRGSCG
eukprot:scaffold41796_cov54-Phaeocystis_antarctica.AAC.3